MNLEMIKKLALDVYNNKVVTFSTNDGESKSANEALRELLLDYCGGTWNVTSFQKVKWDLYSIISEIVTVSTSEPMKERFDSIMNWRDTELGDKMEFYVDNGDLFDVSVVSDGNGNFTRQRIYNNKVNTQAFDLGLAIYEEWTSFFTGRIDFDKMINKVILSMSNKVYKLIGETFAKGYDSINSDFKVSSAMDSTKLLELAGKVGGDVVIYGSKIALSKLPKLEYYVEDLKDIRNGGYVKMFNGIKCVELENVYDKDAKKFSLPNDKLFIIPDGEQILYGGFEGEAYIYDDTTGRRKDRQVEFYYGRRLNLGVAVASKFGVYEITQ